MVHRRFPWQGRTDPDRGRSGLGQAGSQRLTSCGEGGGPSIRCDQDPLYGVCAQAALCLPDSPRLGYGDTFGHEPLRLVRRETYQNHAAALGERLQCDQRGIVSTNRVETHIYPNPPVNAFTRSAIFSGVSPCERIIQTRQFTLPLIELLLWYRSQSPALQTQQLTRCKSGQHRRYPSRLPFAGTIVGACRNGSVCGHVPGSRVRLRQCR